MMKIYLASAVLASLLALGACGPNAEEEAVASEATASAEAEKEREQAEKEAAEERERRAEECTEDVAQLASALDELNSRIQVGLSYSDYTTEVGDVMVAYNRTDIDKISADRWCLGEVAVPLENAFQHFDKAMEVWKKCVGDWDCSIKDKAVDAKMQKHWQRAGTYLEEADAALEAAPEE